MAPPPGRPLQVMNSFDCTAVSPAPLTNGLSAALCGTSFPSLSRFLLYPSSPAALSPPPPFFPEVSDPSESPFLSHTCPPTDPTASHTTTWATLANNTTPSSDSHTSLPMVPPSSVFCPLSSLPTSPQAVTPCETCQSQQLNLCSTAPAPFVDGYTEAAATTWPHATPAILASASPDTELVSVQRAASPTSENIEGKQRYLLAPFQSSLGLSKDLSSLQAPKASPGCSCSLLPVSRGQKRSHRTPAGAVAQLDAAGCAAARHNCYLELETCHRFGHRVPNGLRTCYSLQGRTLLSPPAVELSPPVEETEPLHAGLRLDSPLPTRLSSPTSLHYRTRQDQRENCNGAMTGTFPEANMPTSQTLHHRSENDYNLPLFPCLHPRSLDTLSSHHGNPCISQVWKPDTHEAHSAETEAIQAAAAAFGSLKSPSEEPETSMEEPKSPKRKARRTLQLKEETEGDAADRMEADSENLVTGTLKNEQIFSFSCFAPNREENSQNQRTGTDVVTSWPFLQKRSSKSCSSSLHTCCQQTMPDTTTDQRGTNRRRRRRGTSSPSSKDNIVVSLENSFQDNAQSPVPAAVVTGVPVTASSGRYIANCFKSSLPAAVATGASVAASSERYTANCFKSSPAVPSTTASPAVSAYAPSPTTADSMSPGGDFALSSLTVAPAAVDGVTTRLSALGSTASGAVDAAAVLSAAFTRREAPTAVDGGKEDAMPFSRSVACTAVESTPATSAAIPIPACNFHPRATSAVMRLARSSQTVPCITHGSTTGNGSLSPAAVVSALAAAASSSLSPGAVAYALAVKLFGFTPTPGFLPDPNPFDDLDRYLATELKRATMTDFSDNMKPERTVTPAVPGHHVPPLVSREFALVDRTSSMPTPAASTQFGSGYMDASIRLQVNPPTQRVNTQRNSPITKDDGTHFENLPPTCTTGGENTTAETTPYMLTSPSATAIAAPMYSDYTPSAARHSYSRLAATTPTKPDGFTRDFGKFARRVVTVKDTSQPFSSLTHKAPDGSIRTEGQHKQSGAYRTARSPVKEIGCAHECRSTAEEEVDVNESQTEGTCQVRRSSHPNSVKEYLRCDTLMNSRVPTFDQNRAEERYYMQDGSGSTVCEGYRDYEDGGRVLNGGRSLHAAQFPQKDATF